MQSTLHAMTPMAKFTDFTPLNTDKASCFNRTARHYAKVALRPNRMLNAPALWPLNPCSWPRSSLGDGKQSGP